MRYAAFLRGVNLGPNRRLPMAELRSAVTAAGYTEVATYLQSGNLVLVSEDPPAVLSNDLADLIEGTFQLRSEVVVRNEAELKAIVDANPFPDEAGADPTKVHGVFLDPLPPPDVWAAVASEQFAPDEFRVGDGVVYLHLPNGMARTKLPAALEKAARPSTMTTRNWRSVVMVSAMASGQTA